MPPSSLPKLFEEWGGVDRRANSVNRRVRFAENCKNAIRYLNNSWGARQGIGIAGDYVGGGGITSFVFRGETYVNEYFVAIEDELYSYLKYGGLNLHTYTGSATLIQFRMALHDDANGTYLLELIEDGVVTFSRVVDNGVGQSAPYLLTDLATDLNALSTWVCAISANVPANTIPVAALGSFDEIRTAPGATFSLSYFSSSRGFGATKVFCPVATPFADFWDASVWDELNWEPADFLEHNNVLYIATGYNTQLFKYDGISCYAAGLPLPASHAAAAIAGGALAAQTWNTFIDYEFYDARGNYVQSEPTEYTQVTTAAGNLQIQHTVANIQPTSGYCTFCAIVAGAQVAVTTINVDNGAGGPCTLESGQTVYFYDAISASYVEKVVTVNGAKTTISFAGAVTVADNAVISANLRINIWRHKSGGSLPYLVATIPNNSFAATQTFTDNVADAALEIEYEEAFENRDPPPLGLKYLTAINNNIIGATGKDDTVYFTQIDGPEAWSSSFKIKSKSNQPISGLGANQEVVAVFKPQETHVVTGSLDDNRFRQEMLADAIGCDAHHTISDVAGTLWFYSTLYGFRRLIGTGKIDDVGYRVFPDVVKGASVEYDDRIVGKRCVAIVLPLEQLILFSLVVLDYSGDYYPNPTKSKIYACDYSRQFEEDNEYDVSGRLVQQLPKTRWWPWEGFSFHGGACIYDRKLYFSERRYNDATATIENFISCYRQSSSIEDYADHAIPFEMEYVGGWEDLNEPELNKKWIKASIYSFGTELASNFSITCAAEANLISEVSKATKTLSFGEESDSAGWDFFSWDSAAWGDSEDAREIFTFPPIRATSLRLRFSATVHKIIPVISGWVYQVVPVFRPKIARDR